jgi:hypothetical protein
MRRTLSFPTFLLGASLPLSGLAAAPASPDSNPPAAAPAASGAKADAAPMFKELDTNHDGFLSRSEAKRSADVTARFTQLDVNHDNRVSLREYTEGTKTN